jgi:hypothetical protein
MSTSTGFVVTAGALVLVEDLVTDKWSTPKALRTGVATVLAAYVSAGLDRALPGFGTGLAVLLVLGVALKVTPGITAKLFEEGG